jgi:hypothetical protein
MLDLRQARSKYGLLIWRAKAAVAELRDQAADKKVALVPASDHEEPQTNPFLDILQGL